MRAVIGVFGGMAILFVAVSGVYYYFLIRWRAKKGRQPPQSTSASSPKAGQQPTGSAQVNALYGNSPASESVQSTQNPLYRPSPSSLQSVSNRNTTNDIEADGSADNDDDKVDSGDGAGIRLSRMSGLAGTCNEEQKATAEVKIVTGVLVVQGTPVPPPLPIQNTTTPAASLPANASWLQRTKAKILSHPHVMEAMDFYADNTAEIEGSIRLGMVAFHIINMATSMAFYIRLPTCCHKNANQVGGTAIPAVALSLAILNFVHLLKVFPILTATHFYMTNIYEVVCVVNAIFMVLVLGYGSLSSYLLSLFSSLYAMTFTWKKTLMKLWNMKPFTCWTVFVLCNHVLSLVVNLFQIVLIIVGLALTPYGTGYFFNTSVSGNVGGGNSVIADAWQVLSFATCSILASCVQS